MKTSVKLFLITLLIIGCANLPTNHQGSSLKLYVLDCGSNEVKDISLYSPGYDKNITKTLVVSCYLIKHGDKYLLWDTGLNDKLISKKDGLKIRNGAFKISVKKTLISQLKEIGVSPKQIDYISFSHMHPDHSGNANLFNSSTLILQEKEYNDAFGEESSKHHFSKVLYEGLSNNHTIKLKGDYDVFKDGTVLIKSTPGHTRGHQVLFVKLKNYGPVVLSGDLYHFEKNRKHRRVPVFNYNKSETLKSMTEIESFISKTKSTLWIQHDPDQRKNLKLSPNFYE